MARDVDFENLDEDDVRYLAERPWLVDQAEREGNEDVREVVEEYALSQQAHNEPGTFPVEATTPQEEADDDYDSWKKDELVAEIEDRNSEREDSDYLSPGGTKSDMIERLRADDAAQAE
jgi:hypothetical protein